MYRQRELAYEQEMPRYIRAFAPGGTFLFTVATLDRERALLTRNIAALRETFARERRRRPFMIDAIVILPDHLHCIWTLPLSDADFSSRWREIKARFSARVAHGEALSARRRRKGERAIWQRRFWEHLIRDERDFERCAEYIHWNPVKHGHTRYSLEWPYSSLHHYVERRVYEKNWSAGVAVQGLAME